MSELKQDDQVSRGRPEIYIQQQIRVYSNVLPFCKKGSYNRFKMGEEQFATKFAVEPTSSYDASKLRGKSVVVTGGR